MALNFSKTALGNINPNTIDSTSVATNVKNNVTNSISNKVTALKADKLNSSNCINNSNNNKSFGGANGTIFSKKPGCSDTTGLAMDIEKSLAKKVGINNINHALSSKTNTAALRSAMVSASNSGCLPNLSTFDLFNIDLPDFPDLGIEGFISDIISVAGQFGTSLAGFIGGLFNLNNQCGKSLVKTSTSLLEEAGALSSIGALSTDNIATNMLVSSGSKMDVGALASNTGNAPLNGVVKRVGTKISLNNGLSVSNATMKSNNKSNIIDNVVGALGTNNVISSKSSSSLISLAAAASKDDTAKKTSITGSGVSLSQKLTLASKVNSGNMFKNASRVAA